MGYDSNFKWKSEKQRKAVMSIYDKRHGGGLKLQGQKNATKILQDRYNTENKTTYPRRKILLEKFSKPNTVLTESEIQIIKNNLNSGNDETQKFGKQANDKIWNNEDGIRLTEEQTLKGLEYLNRPNIRNNHFGYREEAILDDFKEFRLMGFTDISNYGSSFKYYVPVFDVYANDGNGFQYHPSSDGISITG